VFKIVQLNVNVSDDACARAGITAPIKVAANTVNPIRKEVRIISPTTG